MKYLLLTAALLFGASGATLAQTSAPSNNPSAHSLPATSSGDPSGQSMNSQGSVKPCTTLNSDTSDRRGGTEKRSTASSGTNSNPGGSESSGNC